MLDHETMCLAWSTPTLEEGHWKARLRPRTASPAESHLVTTAPHQAEIESQRWSHPTTVFLNEKQSSFLVGGRRGGACHGPRVKVRGHLSEFSFRVFFPPAAWISGIQAMSADFVASAFTC